MREKMTKKEIIKEAKKAKKENIILYYTYITNPKTGKETLVSNFDKDKMSDGKLIKLCEEGILTKDWDTYTVN